MKAAKTKQQKLTRMIVIVIIFIGTTTIYRQVMALSTPNALPPTPANKEWQLKWNDEFSGPTLDESNWNHATGRVTGAQNCYAVANTTVSSGTAKIVGKYEPGFQCYSVKRDFTSGFINTKDKHAWKYGYFEARIKMPKSNSVWPAFWMSPQDSVYGGHPRSGEIDIMEARGFDPKHGNGDAHWGLTDSNRIHKGKQGNVDDFREWHTYGLDWSEGKLDWYIDGKKYHTIDNFGAPNATTHPGPFNQPFYIRLCMQIGGPYLKPHEDAYQNISQLPATMEVDYVRVYQLANAGTTPAPPKPTTPAPPKPTTPAPPKPTTPIEVLPDNDTPTKIDTDNTNLDINESPINLAVQEVKRASRKIYQQPPTKTEEVPTAQPSTLPKTGASFSATIGLVGIVSAFGYRYFKK
jgi:beta-glucanase (GH16 family)